MRLTVARLAPALIQAGVVSAALLEAFDDAMAAPEMMFTSSPVFSVWGGKSARKVSLG